MISFNISDVNIKILDLFVGAATAHPFGAGPPAADSPAAGGPQALQTTRPNGVNVLGAGAATARPCAPARPPPIHPPPEGLRPSRPPDSMA